MSWREYDDELESTRSQRASAQRHAEARRLAQEQEEARQRAEWAEFVLWFTTKASAANRSPVPLVLYWRDSERCGWRLQHRRDIEPEETTGLEGWVFTVTRSGEWAVDDHYMIATDGSIYKTDDDGRIFAPARRDSSKSVAAVLDQSAADSCRLSDLRAELRPMMLNHLL